MWTIRTKSRESEGVACCCQTLTTDDISRPPKNKMEFTAKKKINTNLNIVQEKLAYYYSLSTLIQCGNRHTSELNVSKHND